VIVLFQKLLYNSVLPTVRELTESPDHLVIILPTLLALISNATDDEYRSLLLPELRKVLAMTRPVQVTFQHRVTYQTRFITPAFNFIAAEAFFVLMWWPYSYDVYFRYNRHEGAGISKVTVSIAQCSIHISL